ncbi:MAG TPA: TPM domain-containing protein [Taishania sp.]|nr:TPM domain-containing protein [Taishania sp.]
MDAPTPSDFLSKEEVQEVVLAIKEAECNTSGEIRVHIDQEEVESPFEHAKIVFDELEMYTTQDRNGILFYFNISTHSFVIIGDEGIHQKVGDEFWDIIRNAVINEFTKGNYKVGLINGISEVGKQLKSHFPYQANDKNELPNEISGI